MIKCNLAVLLAERGLKMADVINDTSLSKTAVRGLYYNYSKGIQYETLEVLCNYLKVEPHDLIKKLDFGFNLQTKSIKKDLNTIDYTLNVKLDTRTQEYIVRLKLLKIVDAHTQSTRTKILPGLYFEVIYNTDFQQNVFSQITQIERDKLEDFLMNDFVLVFGLTDQLLREVHYINDFDFASENTD